MNDLSAHENSGILIAQAEHSAVATTTTEKTHETAESGSEEPGQWVFFGYGFLAFLILTILAIIGTRKLKLVPKGLQNFLEMVFEMLYGIPEMVMGPRGREYAPFVSTYFLFIVTMNLIGLLPFGKAGTASLSVTMGLAIIAFIMVQYYGFKTHGFRYLAHFAGPVPAMAILIFPLEIISEFIRPVSLSFRLFGNMYGEEKVIAALAHLSPNFPVVPLFMLPLQLLTCVLQGYVFALLVTVYISLATEKHSEGHAEASASTAH